MYNIIALVGESGSGKDTLMREALKKNHKLHKIISCTTRPKRKSEIDGIHYHYLTGEDFGHLVIHGEMLEATIFNNWFYGTRIDALNQDAVNIGIFNPSGIESIISDPRVNVKVYYVAAAPKTRLLRQLNREDDPNCDEIIRRYRTDVIDFDLLDFEHETVYNNNLKELKLATSTILNSFMVKGKID